MRFASMLLLIPTIVLLVSAPASALVQGGPPCPIPPCDTGPPGLPIDDHLPILFVVGIVYGSLKIYQLIKKRSSKN